MSRSKPLGVTVLVLLVVSLVLVAAAVTGCGSSAPAAQAPASPPASAAATTTASSTAQLCAECGGLGAPPETTGEAIVEGGVQVVSIAIDGGYYVPNRITAKAGTPVKVVFTGDAKGCVAKPKFAALDKTVDLTGVGTGTIELGALAAGTYEFTCGMGVNRGTITVQ